MIKRTCWWKQLACVLFVLPLISGCLAATPAAQTNNALHVWTASAMQRVGQHDAPAASTTAKLAAGRGEYEAFQIVVRAEDASLVNVNISVSELRGPHNSVINASNVQLYREHFVYVAESSPDMGEPNRPLGAGWYADALIPFADPITNAPPSSAPLKAVPFDLAPETNQPIWVDLFIPYGTPPGEYSGDFTVTSDQGRGAGTIELTVWNFDLPRRPSLQSSFGVWDEAQGQATALELLRHKLMPRDVSVSVPANLADRVSLTSANLRFWSGANVETCQMKAPPSVASLVAATKPSGVLLYNYTADEIDACTNLYDPLKAWARNLHRAGVQNLVTMTPRPELYDDGLGTGRSVVDIWVMLPVMYDNGRQRVAEVLQKGDTVWSYNSLVQDEYSPKWQIDFEPMNFRIQPGFIHQSLGITGLLYWRVDLWTNDPWNNVQTYHNKDQWFYGDGMLLYPGKQVGLRSNIASMRLKWLREGVEDYEYVALLKQRGLGDEALAISRSVAADWRTWTRDPQAIEQARQQLAALLVASNTYPAYLPMINAQ